MQNYPLEKVVNLLLGISWSLLIFGTTLVFFLTIFSTSFGITVILTFVVFFFFAIIVTLLEVAKKSLNNQNDVREILKLMKNEK